MGSPARAALLVAMTLGLGGCFESQRDETYEGTVVLDDVDVRVLHAVTDAPALRLSAGGEARVEKLDYGRAATFSLPANHHSFRAEGYTGLEAPEPLLENLQGNLTEGKRHDLLLAGSLEDDSARAILLTQDDEPFEPFDEEDETEVGDGLNSEEDSGEDGSGDDDEPVRDVRFRAAHLAPGGGEVDLYLGDDRSGDPDATLDYGESTDALRVEADVYRLQITSAGNSGEVLYDSGGNLDWESEDDLLVTVVPATGAQRAEDSPLSLMVVDGSETRHHPDQSQQAELAFVNASGSTVTVTEDDRDVSWPDVEPLEIRPDDDDALPSGDYEAAEAGGYSVDLEDEDGAVYGYGFRLSQGDAGTLVLRELPSEADEPASASFLASGARPVATNARVRLLNAASADESSLDVYLIEGECGGNNGSLPVDGVIPEPLVSSLGYPNRSLVVPAAPGDYQLVVTAEDDPSDERLCESVTLSEKGIYELVIAQPDGSADPPELISVEAVR
ncbi:MAG: hypothetical protein ACQERE_07325 [Pseudomonadota bacterium]